MPALDIVRRAAEYCQGNDVQQYEMLSVHTFYAWLPCVFFHSQHFFLSKILGSKPLLFDSMCLVDEIEIEDLVPSSERDVRFRDYTPQILLHAARLAPMPMPIPLRASCSS